MAYKQTKYIVYPDHFGSEIMIIFPAILNHSDVARRNCGKDAVIGAGFLDVSSEVIETENADMLTSKPEFNCYGFSESLGGIKSRPEDSALAKRTLFGFD